MGTHSRISSEMNNLEDFKQKKQLFYAVSLKTRSHTTHVLTLEGWLSAVLLTWSINCRFQLLVLFLWNISGPGISCSHRLMSQVGKLWLSLAAWVWFQGFQAADHFWCLCSLTPQLRHVKFLGQGSTEPQTLSSVLAVTSLQSLRMLIGWTWKEQEASKTKYPTIEEWLHKWNTAVTGNEWWESTQ
jgi:hypothetical protein